VGKEGEVQLTPVSGSSIPVLDMKVRGAFDSAKNHKRQRRKRQSVTAQRENSQTPKFVRSKLHGEEDFVASAKRFVNTAAAW